LERTLNQSTDGFSYLYLLAKIHKQPLKTRAIISYSSSICHGIATWVDKELKKITKHLPYVATSSHHIVKDITNRNWHNTSQLFTMDAVSMYTNIHLGHALPVIINFLTNHRLGQEIRQKKIVLDHLNMQLNLS